MRIFFSSLNKINKEQRIACQTIIEKVLNATEHFDNEISIAFISKKEMISLQKTYLNKEYATDVLSFPTPEEEKHLPLCKNYLGDLVICLPIAKAQAKEFGHSLALELAALVAHGFYHLLGMDHEISLKAAREQMKCEMILLKKAGIDPNISLIGRTNIK